MVQVLLLLLGEEVAHTYLATVGIDLAPSTSAHLIDRFSSITAVTPPLCDRPVHPIFLLLGTKVSQNLQASRDHLGCPESSQLVCPPREPKLA